MAEGSSISVKYLFLSKWIRGNTIQTLANWVTVSIIRYTANTISGDMCANSSKI